MAAVCTQHTTRADGICPVVRNFLRNDAGAAAGAQGYSEAPEDQRSALRPALSFRPCKAKVAGSSPSAPTPWPPMADVLMGYAQEAEGSDTMPVPRLPSRQTA